MFDKILVAIDSSAISEGVFNQALTLAKALKANLMLLHVLSFEEVGSPNVPMFSNLDYYPMMSAKGMELYSEQWQAVEQQGLELLRSRANTAFSAGVSAEFTQTPGSPGRTICALAQTWGANLIVLGRRGHSGFSELVLGSVSNYVLHHAPCSVLAVQNLVKVDAPESQINQSELVS